MQGDREVGGAECGSTGLRPAILVTEKVFAALSELWDLPAGTEVGILSEAGLSRRQSPWRRVASSALALMGPLPRRSERGVQSVVGQRRTGDMASAVALVVDWGVGHEVTTVLESMPSIRWMHVLKTGVDHLPLEYLRARGVVVTCVAEAYSEAIAEYVVGAIYCCLKRTIDHYERGRRRACEVPESADVRGKRVLILGTGRIGRSVARLSRANGLEVLGVNTSGRPSADFPEACAWRDLATLWDAADVVINCLPLTGTTRGIVSHDLISRMKEGSAFINVARMETVVSDALIRGVEHRRPEWAFLDTEVPNSSKALRAHPRIVLTNHSAYSSPGNLRRLADGTSRNINAFLKGAPLLGTVDLGVGY